VAVTPVSIGGGQTDAHSEVMRLQVDADRRYQLAVFNAGLACCAVEFVAATMHHDAFAALGAGQVTDPAAAQVLVISGTVTDKLAPAIKRVYDALPDPKYVVSFGSCANCGGPYWDSYCVTKGVDQIIPVDVYVPGCPPRPEALLDGLAALGRTNALGAGP
jgi:NADH-quinone oxidoreductase subunit B